jgi:hypothetical protein
MFGHTKKKQKHGSYEEYTSDELKYRVDDCFAGNLPNSQVEAVNDNSCQHKPYQNIIQVL